MAWYGYGLLGPDTGPDASVAQWLGALVESELEAFTGHPRALSLLCTVVHRFGGGEVRKGDESWDVLDTR